MAEHVSFVGGPLDGHAEVRPDEELADHWHIDYDAGLTACYRRRVRGARFVFVHDPEADEPAGLLRRELPPLAPQHTGEWEPTQVSGSVEAMAVGSAFGVEGR